MRDSRFLGYGVRWISRTVGTRWGCRLLARLPKAVTEFEAIVSYRGVKLAVDTSEYLGRSIFYYDEFERAQEAVFMKLSAGRMVFDIGANIGIFTMLAVLNGARVFAFEPSRMVRARLEQNVALNGFGRAVTVVAEAIADTEGMLSFYETRSGNLGVGRVFSFGPTHLTKDYDVHADTIDAFVERFGMPDVIKIDIEGAEWLALAGATHTLSASNAPQLLIEFHPSEITALGGSVGQCVKALEEYGYQRYEIVGADTSTHVWSCFSKWNPDTKQLRPC